MQGSEFQEEERRYQEAGGDEVRTLDSRVLDFPLQVLNPALPVTAGPDETLASVAPRMAKEGHGCVVVVADGCVTGIVTERDLVTRLLAKGRAAEDTKLADIMTSDPEVLHLDDTVGFALHKMAVREFRHLPVVDEDGRPVGLVTQKDGVRFLAGFFPEQAVNQPPDSFAQNPPNDRYGG